MTVLCAWCSRQIAQLAAPRQAGSVHAHASVSHGMCPTCLQERLAQITPRR